MGMFTKAECEAMRNAKVGIVLAILLALPGAAKAPAPVKVLNLGRTDVFVGEVIVGWIEYFDYGDLSEVHYDLIDGHRCTLMDGRLDPCLKVIRDRMGKYPPTLNPVFRPGSARTWRQAHPEDYPAGGE